MQINQITVFSYHTWRSRGSKVYSFNVITLHSGQAVIVSDLVTVGSQSPYFYRCIVSLGKTLVHNVSLYLDVGV